MNLQASSASGFTSNMKTEENALFTNKIPAGKVLRMPIAHGEGRLLFPKEKEKEILAKLIDDDMVVFRYCDKNGNVADGKYPANPNGSFYDIAGICNREGNIFGLNASSGKSHVLVATTRLDTVNSKCRSMATEN